MADQIRATPRSPILGLFSDLVNLPLQYMSSPERTQQSQGVAQFLYDTSIPKTLESMSYGHSLFSGAGGLGGTTRMLPETANALLNVLPFAPVAGRVAGRMIKATEGMPVGMGIKLVDDLVNTPQKGSKLVNIPIDTIEHGESVMPGGKLTWLGAREKIKEYAERKTSLPPIDVVSNESGVPWMVADGSHRLEAAKLRGDKTIAAYVSPYDKEGLQLIKNLSNVVGKAIKATEGMPVGMGIKDVGSKIIVKPPTDDIYEVMDATFNYGKLGGNKTIPIDQLTGGVRMSDPTEARRVKELADKISSPEGYISRIIVDDSGNVLEGQHRLEALRLLGEKNVPVAVIEDLSNKYDISAMQNAIKGKFRSDQSNQLIRQAIDTLEEAGSVEKALSDYSMPPMFQQPFQDAIRASQKVTPTPIESPTFTDPFGNTIGSSIR